MAKRILVGVCALALVLGGCGGEQTAEPNVPDAEGVTDAVTTAAEATGPYDDTAAEATTGGDEEGTNPAAGEKVFASAGCGNCHALAAANATGTVGPNLDESNPSFDLAVDRVTNGKDEMPAFKGQLSEQQIRDVSAYVAASSRD